jgi:hypothetical protein
LGIPRSKLIMPGRKVSHSESRWAQLPDTLIRCNGTLQSGKRCHREAIDGSVVCEIHGGLAPQVRRRAAERVLLSADEAIQVIKSFISDPIVPAGVRLKAAQDLADRAGLAAAQVHKILPMVGDPVMEFFEGILEQDGLTVLEPHPKQPRELESGDLDIYGQDPREYEEDHNDAEHAEVITMPDTELEPERQHSDRRPRPFPPELAPSRRRPR